MKKEKRVHDLISKMTIEEKVGQCFVIGFVGTIMTPSITERIKKIKPAGIRVGLTHRTKTALHDPSAYNENFLDRVVRKPKDTVKDFVKDIPVPYVTNEEYCTFLNSLKQNAMDNGHHIPMHITFDMEGDASADYFRGGIHYFPSQMGMGKTGDKSLAHHAAWAVGRQLSSIGFSWIHSPVLDVNTNPLNPEIGTRSFSENSEVVTEFALEALKGYKETNIITTGKHFPGRGASAGDAHKELPVIDINREELMEHIKP